MIAERGTRDKLEKYFDLNRPLKITLQTSGAATYDYCCFGVDADEKLSDDRYMIFYNQLSSPSGEIVGKEISSGMEFTIRLNDLPERIQKLVFTCSIDGAGVMQEISSHKIFLGEQISADFSGGDFQQEKAITSLEIYRKNGWRFNVVALGFNGGLDALLAFYGGEEIKEGVGEQDSGSRENILEPSLPPSKIENEKINTEILESKKYRGNYSENGLFAKVSGTIKSAGLKLIYQALLLFYVTENPNCPMKVRAVIFSVLGYFILPVDMIPDFMPAVGYSDDASAIFLSIGIAQLYIDDEVKNKARNKIANLFGDSVLEKLI